MQPALTAQILSSLSHMLAAYTGLHFPMERWGDLERGIAAAAPDLGMSDAKSCADRLLSGPLTHREIEILAGRLTVGETYFFRDKGSFDVLEQKILPDLLQARDRAERRLRIWSAGCCTGEEPYSIAMLLDRMVPGAAAYTTILATDINPVFLRKAAAGEYGDWSFRSAPEWLKSRYFHSRKNSRFELDDSIRKRVTFSYLNLADDTYPSLTSNTNAMDVIFCRNVLMYFSTERARTVIDKLYRALVDGGWLIVSPAETSSSLFSRFTTVEFDGAILYRKDTSVTASHFVSHVTAPATDCPPETWHGSGENNPAAGMSTEAFLEAGPATSLPVVADTNSAQISPEQNQADCKARECANQGRLGEATEWCRRAIAADRLNPAHHYLLAAIQRELGQEDDAAQSLARALYLAPDFVLAHYALGNLHQSQGRRREALRHFDNTLAALRAHPPDEILPESDGLTVGRLEEIIESMRSSMPIPASGI